MNGKEFRYIEHCANPDAFIELGLPQLQSKILNPTISQRSVIDRIRMITREGAKKRVLPEQIKKAIKPLKLKLPVFTVTLPYLQIDVDFKIENENHVNAQHCKDVMIDINSFAIVALSPSGFGVKAFMKVTGDESLVRSRLATELKRRGVEGEFKIDNLSRNTDCFMPYDTNAYFNDNARIYRFPEAPKRVESPPVSKTTSAIKESDIAEYALRKAFNIARYRASGDIHSHEGKRLYAYLCYQYGISEVEAWQYFAGNAGSLDITSKEFSRRWRAMEKNANAGHKRAILANDIRNEYAELKERQAVWKRV